MTPRHIWSRFSAWLDDHLFQALALIVVFALAFNALRLWSEPLTYQTGQTDNWWTVVVNLLDGKGYASCFPKYFPFCGPTNQITAMREPAPVFLFTVTALLSNQSLEAAALVEMALNLAVLVALFWLTREWANPRAALLAALLWAIYLPAIKLVAQVSGDLLATCGLVVGMYFVLRARRTNRLRDWVVAGLGVSVSVMSRSAMLIVAATLIGGLLVEGALKWRAKQQSLLVSARPALVMGLAVLALLGPWVVRNDLALGSPVIGSTLTGYNLYRHNYILATDNYLRYVGADEGEAEIKALIARRSDLNGTENEAQMEAVYRSEGIRIIAAHPAQYLLLSAYRFWPLWFNWQIREAYGEHTEFVDYVMMAQQALLLVLALVGWRGNESRTWMLTVGMVLLSLAYMAVNSQMRYIVPVMPFIISLSAAGLIRLTHRRA